MVCAFSSCKATVRQQLCCLSACLQMQRTMESWPRVRKVSADAQQVTSYQALARLSSLFTQQNAAPWQAAARPLHSTIAFDGVLFCAYVCCLQCQTLLPSPRPLLACCSRMWPMTQRSESCLKCRLSCKTWVWLRTWQYLSSVRICAHKIIQRPIPVARAHALSCSLCFQYGSCHSACALHTDSSYYHLS